MKHLIVFAVLCVAAPVAADDAKEPLAKRTKDVIYGRKYGAALTMDIFTPNKNAYGTAVIFAVSGGWFSSHDFIDSPFLKPSISELTKRGYTYSIEDEFEAMQPGLRTRAPDMELPVERLFE